MHALKSAFMSHCSMSLMLLLSAHGGDINQGNRIMKHHIFSRAQHAQSFTNRVRWKLTLQRCDMVVASQSKFSSQCCEGAKEED